MIKAGCVTALVLAFSGNLNAQGPTAAPHQQKAQTPITNLSASKVASAETLAEAAQMHALAKKYIDLGQQDKALPLELRALAIIEKRLRPEHLDTVWSIARLASTYSSLAQYDNALILKIRALNILEKVIVYHLQI